MGRARKPIILALAMLAGGCAPASSPPPPTAAFPSRLHALGTEPFWSIAIAGARVGYTTPEHPDERAAQVTRREADGVLHLSGNLDGEPLAIAIRRQACSDGMSDRTYPFAVSVRLGAMNLQGCAQPS